MSESAAVTQCQDIPRVGIHSVKCGNNIVRDGGIGHVNEAVSKVDRVVIVPRVSESEAENVTVVSRNSGIPSSFRHRSVRVEIAGPER